MTTKNVDNHIAILRGLLIERRTLQSIADEIDRSRERVRQILKESYGISIRQKLTVDYPDKVREMLPEWEPDADTEIKQEA